jgi:hypothetical protein
MQFTHIFYLSECVMINKVDEKKTDSILKKDLLRCIYGRFLSRPRQTLHDNKKQRHHKHWETHSSKMVAKSR